MPLPSVLDQGFQCYEIPYMRGDHYSIENYSCCCHQRVHFMSWPENRDSPRNVSFSRHQVATRFEVGSRIHFQFSQFHDPRQTICILQYVISPIRADYLCKIRPCVYQHGYKSICTHEVQISYLEYLDNNHQRIRHISINSGINPFCK